MPDGASTSRISWSWRRAPRSFDEALAWTAEVYGAAGAMMAERGLLQGVADEGGFWPAFASNEAALDALMQAIERAGFTPGDEIAISVDVAASEFYEGGLYRLARDGRALDADGMTALLIGWLDRYPIVSIEDPLAEHDPEGLRRFTAGGRRPGADRRRRFSRHRCGAGARRGGGRRLQRRADQAEPGGYLERGPGGARGGARRRNGGRSSRPARARPRM